MYLTQKQIFSLLEKKGSKCNPTNNPTADYCHSSLLVYRGKRGETLLLLCCGTPTVKSRSSEIVLGKKLQSLLSAWHASPGRNIQCR